MRSWQCRGGGGSIGSCFNNNAVELSKRCSLTFVCDALYEGTSFVRTTTRRVCHRVRYIRIERHNLCFFLARSLSFVVLPATVEGAKNPQGNRDVVNGHGHVPLPGRTCQSSCNVRMPSETHAALLPKHTYFYLQHSTVIIVRSTQPTMERARGWTRELPAARCASIFKQHGAKISWVRVDTRRKYRSRRDSDAITFFVVPELGSAK